MTHALALALALCAWAAAANADERHFIDDHSAWNPPPGKLLSIMGQARVIDGDTIVIGDRHIRLSGIDAPEMGQTCTGTAGALYECGRDARAVMVEIIQGEPVTCRPQTRDRYGRMVAVCGTDAVPDIGGELVRRGWAVPYTFYDPGCSYCDAMTEVRAAGRGIWSGSFQEPSAWREEHRR